MRTRKFLISTLAAGALLILGGRDAAFSQAPQRTSGKAKAAAARPAKAGAANAGAWTQWRGPNRDAISADKQLLAKWGPSGPPLAWKASGLGAGFSSLAIAGERIYTMGDFGNEQFVLALARNSGKVLWKAKVGAAHRDQYGGPRATPTIDGDVLYTLGTEGDLVCLEAATGKERWRRNIARDFGAPMPGWKFSESPTVDGNKLIITPTSSRAGMVALDKATGREIWRSTWSRIGSRGMDEAAYSSVVISNGAGVKQYVQLTNRGAVGVRAQDGKFLWGYNRIANDTANIPTPIVRGDYVFVSTGYRDGGSALLKLARSGDGVTASEVYYLEANRFQNHHGGMVLIGDYLYAGHGHNRGFPICIEFLTGKVRWGGDIRNGGTGSAAVVAADGRLYFRYQNGSIKLIEATPDGYRETGSFDLPDVRNPSWSHPVVLNGKLYLREQDTLYVFNLRG
ncbi:MAG: PQQ-binding-like beta-propeller repeat protein [Candidatus Acidiferrales bacterium]